MVEHEGPSRPAFTSELDRINTKVLRLFAMVSESLVGATESFLNADREAARREARSVTERDEVIDALEKEISLAVEKTLLFQSPVAGDFRHLISTLRIVPELERSGDLAEHIASRAEVGLGDRLTPTVRGIVDEIGAAVARMWETSAAAWAAQNPAGVAGLPADDEVVNALHTKLWDALVVSGLPAEVTMEMALVARFYERLGDHAKHVGRHLPGA